MRSFLKKFSAVAAALALALAPLVLSAQGFNVNGLQVQPYKAVFAGDNLSAVDTDVAIYIKYVGTNASAATVAVAAGGDLTFVDSGGASDDFECPVSGALGGVIDVSDAACNTLGEVVDTINGKCTGCTAGNWVAVIAAGLRSDSSNDNLNALSATSAKAPEGLGLLWDTSVVLHMTGIALPGSNGGRTLGIQNWLPGLVSGPVNSKIPEKPFEDTRTTLLYASGLMTTTDNVANLLNVYCVKEKYPGGSTAGSEVVQTLYTEAAAATTVTGKVDEFVNAGGLTCDGGKMLFRMNGNTTLTVPTVVLSGYSAPRKF